LKPRWAEQKRSKKPKTKNAKNGADKKALKCSAKPKMPIMV
jgi:hypothetical protein